MSLANDYKSISDRVTVIAATTGNKTDKIRVAAYCRVSTDKTDQVNSFITQMRYYTDYIKSNPKMILIGIDFYERPIGVFCNEILIIFLLQFK